MRKCPEGKGADVTKQVVLGWRRRGGVALLGFIVALSPHGSVKAQAKSSVHQKKVVGKYSITLIIGAAEVMSMQKGKGGERMLGGKNATCHMAMHTMDLARVNTKGDKAPVQNCNRHVEVHVYDKKTGKALTHASVSISLKGKSMTGGAILIGVPIMTMVGQRASMNDFHYGNNIYAPTGKYTVQVKVNGTTATFAVSLLGSM
jgi:hypothetical protein